MEKTRTLRGVHRGEKLIIGYRDSTPIVATIWDNMLLLKRNAIPHPLVKTWRGRYIVGGRFWLEVPHAFVKNPLNLICYPDTLMNFVIRPIRSMLIPGYTPTNRITKWLYTKTWRYFYG